MKSNSDGVTWVTTNVQNLYRHKTGNYYGRFEVAGKKKWVALRTKKFSTAKVRLTDENDRVTKGRANGAMVDGMNFTFRDLVKIYTERFREDPDLAPASKHSREVVLKRVKATWPQLWGMRPVAVKPAAVAEWANRLRTQTQHAPPGAKTKKKGYSAVAVNQAVQVVERLFELSVETGGLFRNPLKNLPPGLQLRKKIEPKKINLPSRTDMTRLLDEIETPPPIPDEMAYMRPLLTSQRTDCGEFARFLALSGARQQEAAAMTWEHIRDKTLIIPGTKTETSREREVPQIPAMAELLARIRARRQAEGEQTVGRIFRVSECQKSVDRACKDLGLKRITHHDFRHFFATTCIEAGVDIPTVARWLGHADGGALAMKVYGHLRLEHSLTAAAKVQMS